MSDRIEMKANHEDISARINELSDKATQLLTFLSFAMVAAVLLETAQPPILDPHQNLSIRWGLRFWALALFPILVSILPVKDFKWANAQWYHRARWWKIGFMWASVLLIIVGVVAFLSAIW